MLLPLLAFTLAAGANSASGTERRCGWLQNPTPANWWLIDRDGEWLIGAQGGYQALGMDEMPDMSTAGWVEVNGHHGYGCACMVVTSDRGNWLITRIISARPVPLRQCRADRRLPRLSGPEE
jgi:uncharacterized protein DUF4087